jgi:two-component system, OmpR family, sensor kinase
VSASPGRSPSPWRLHAPDDVLLRRFGLVRAVGGTAYVVGVAVLFGIVGWQVWPLLLGVPILSVATVAYFVTSNDYPRLSVAGSLSADALVLGGAVAFLGGTGSGLVMLYSIVVVSAGILLGPISALAFTGLSVVLGLLQLVMEEFVFTPVLLHRPELPERVPILLVSLAGVASVGYLSATYADRLHELIAIAGAETESLRSRGRRRRSFVQQAWGGIQEPLEAIWDVAESLDDGAASLSRAERARLAGRLRMTAARLHAEASQLADLGLLDAPTETRPMPIRLRRTVQDCLHDLHGRLEPYTVHLDVPDIKIVAEPRAARRVVFNLLENVADHTPPGTDVRVSAVATAGYGVLAVTDNGPGIPPEAAARLFDPPGGGLHPRVGLPLVRELCEAMGAQMRYEPGPGGRGARFLLRFRLAPSAAPGPDDDLRQPAP